MTTGNEFWKKNEGKNPSKFFRSKSFPNISRKSIKPSLRYSADKKGGDKGKTERKEGRKEGRKNEY